VNQRALSTAIPVFAAAVAILAFVLWFGAKPAQKFEERAPGADKPADVTPHETAPFWANGQLVRSSGTPASELQGEWPRFRGANFDGVSRDKTPLARQWPVDGPPVTWSVDVGEGYAGAAISNGRVYILDYDRESQADCLRCLSLADGKDIWRYSYPVGIKRNHGMSRTVPAVSDGYVVSLGPKCHVICLNAITGEFKWGVDLVRDYGSEVPQWYAGQCPLIDGGRAIIAPGAKALMVAFDLTSGSIVWQTPNPNGWGMTHSSIMPMEFGSERMYVYCASGGVVGVSATDGRILWETDVWKINIANVPSPLVVGDGRILLTGGYDSGSLMLKLRRDGEHIVADVQFRLSPSIFACEQHTPILFVNHIYGVRPDGQLTCMSVDGKVVWTSGTEHTFDKGLGPLLVAGGMLYVMDSRGFLTLVEATASGYHELARAKVLTGHDSWGPMAIAGGRLIVRDFTKMVCLDVSHGKGE